MPKNRLLILGFDGMDADLVRNWIGQDQLPNFRELLDTSAWCQFKISPEYSSGMVWPTINTGLSPRQHQAYFGSRIIGGTYRLRPRRLDDIRGEPFWHKFAAQGRRVIVADVPFARVVPGVAGVHVQGWGQHDPIGSPRSQPRHLLRKIRREFGAYPLSSSLIDSPSKHSSLTLKHAACSSIRRRTDILRWLSNRQEWDLFYAVFAECHTAGHVLWPRTLTGVPVADPLADATSIEALQEIYMELDDSLGKLRNSLGRDATTVAIMSHGMGPNLHGDHLFPELLRKFNSSWTGEPVMPEKGSLLDRAWEHSVGHLPMGLRVGVRNQLPTSLRQWISIKRKQYSNDWRKSISFALPGLDGFSAVRVNLAGREPTGRIQAGEEYHRYVADLADEIGRWVDCDSGQPAVSSVYRAADDYDPAHLGPAPDIMIWWNKKGPVHSVRSPALGTVTNLPCYSRSGEHKMHSLLAIQHAVDKADQCFVEGMTLMDIAPTILELARLDVDPALAGQPRVADLLGFRSARNGKS